MSGRMTLDQFLDRYAPNVLRPMGGWYVTQTGLIRRRSNGGICCPLTAEADRSSVFWNVEAIRLGIGIWDAAQITCAADGDGYYEPRDRARLLTGLGLTERA